MGASIGVYGKIASACLFAKIGFLILAQAGARGAVDNPLATRA